MGHTPAYIASRFRALTARVYVACEAGELRELLTESANYLDSYPEMETALTNQRKTIDVLLEALEEIDKEANALTLREGGGYWQVVIQTTIDIARKAIAKAKGES